MAENIEKFEKLKEDLAENLDTLLGKYLENFNENGRIKVDQASVLIKVILKEYEIEIDPWVVEDEEKGWVKVASFVQRFQEFIENQLKKFNSLVVLETKPGKMDFSTVSFPEFVTRINTKASSLPNSIESSKLSLTLLYFIGQCRIVSDPNDLKLLKKKIKSIKNSGLTVSQPQALALLNEWYDLCHSSQDLRSRIMKSIQEFEKLNSTALSIDEKSSIDNLIYSLKVQLKKIPNKPQIKSESIAQQSIQGLSEIFKHYSKQQFLLGKNPTFDNIQKNLEVLNQAKFLKFCKDFGVIQGTPSEQSQRKKVKKVQKVYKDNSEYNKEMHEHQFFKAVGQLAGLYLDAEYDLKHATGWNSLSHEMKVEQFFELMGFHDPGIYNKKLKDIGIHFGAEKNSRIPVNDPSKRYKYDPEKYRKLKMSVDEWRAKKSEEEKMKSSKKSRERVRSIVSSRKLESYSSRNFGKARKRTDIEKFQEKEPEQFKDLQEESKPYTFRSIQELKIEELSKFDKDFSIKELIDESEDQVLNDYLRKNQEPRKTHTLGKSMSAYILPSSSSNKSEVKLPSIKRIIKIA